MLSLADVVEEHRQRRKSTSDYRSHDFIDMILSYFSEDEGANRAIKSGVTVKPMSQWYGYGFRYEVDDDC
ncbi:hypothetical protein EJ110_NYTH51555 [Nymphaea thermarum]|nr:hypothetical protein EJ110_NYTH51555 [Nymphaea thermarum]